MLTRLEIQDYGLIAHARIEFASGATIFTGETGSGKTMVLGALSIGFGARAEAGMVRRDAERAIVTIVFEPNDALRKRLADDGFELDPGEEATIVRELTNGGKSSLRLCGQPATAAYVRELAAGIAEIIGQHEAQRLVSSAYHVELLDRFAGSDALGARARVARAYDRCEELRGLVAANRSRDAGAAAEVEEARYARDEIAAAAIETDEEQTLNARRRYLENVERIEGALHAAHAALTGEERAATASLGDAEAALSAVRDAAESLEELAAQIRLLQSEVGELAARVSGLLDATEYEPNELERVNERLDLLARLKRKYGGTSDAVLAYARECENAIAAYERREERGVELDAALAVAENELRDAAALLSKARRKAARTLGRRVREEFADIALESARFEVALEPLAETSRTGAESVAFSFSANAGEPLRPLARIASGGELSRVLLALVVALAEARDRSVLVFDEIDIGIGGATAAAVGNRIAQLARDDQVVCVTHLAQLARWAERHYVLEKRERRGSTTIDVRAVTGAAERASEIARMLSGEPREAALEHARELLAQTAAS